MRVKRTFVGAFVPKRLNQQHFKMQRVLLMMVAGARCAAGYGTLDFDQVVNLRESAANHTASFPRLDDAIVDKLADRSLTTPPAHHANMDTTVLGKAAQPMASARRPGLRTPLSQRAIHASAQRRGVPGFAPAGTLVPVDNRRTLLALLGTGAAVAMGSRLPIKGSWPWSDDADMARTALPAAAVVLRVAETTALMEDELRQSAVLSEQQRIESGIPLIGRRYVVNSVDILLRNSKLASVPRTGAAVEALREVARIAERGAGALSSEEYLAMAGQCKAAREQLGGRVFELMPRWQRDEGRAVQERIRAADQERMRELA